MDKRSALERMLWDKIGQPLYYCADCLRAVDVTTQEDVPPIIKRPCGEECDCGIIAPRKSILAGEGGLNLKDSVKLNYWKIAAALTGRCV